LTNGGCVPYNVRTGIIVPIVADVVGGEERPMNDPLDPRAVFERYAAEAEGRRARAGVPAEADVGTSLVRRYYEMWNTGEGAVADQVLSPYYVDHAHPAVIGPAASRSIAPRFHRAYPEARMTLEILGADAEFVAVRNTIRKSHDGVPVELAGTALFRIGEGRILEQWSWYPGTKPGRLGWPKKEMARAAHR
jgi:hypothetical protein